MLVALGVTGEEATERKLAYSNNGALSHLIDANDNRTTYEYDGHDRLIKTRFPLPTIGSNSSSTTDYEQLTLDANGNVTNRRLRDAQNIGYTWDALNRLTAKNLPASEPDATYTYDLLNRVTSAVQNSITNAMTWDALGRKLTETAPQGTVTSEYDLAGRRTKVTLPGSTSLFANYDYDLLGNVTFIRENGATSGVGVLATYQYDSLSRRSSVTFGNGVVQGYTYDNAARLATQTNDLASTANDLTQMFSYNPASQISSVTRSNDLYAWTGHFNQNEGSTPNGLNQIGNVGAKTVTHDTKGNITGVGTDSYGYTSENFLTSGPGSTTLGYDPMGRLYQVASGGTTIRMGYDGLDRIAEYDASNAVQRRYIHGPGVDNPIAWYEGSGTTTRRFLSSDERGSIVSVTDGSGTVLALNRYDEYGAPQSSNLGKFGYTGQAWVPEVKLWYYKARFLRPDIGRFMQTDPIGYSAGPNLYGYVGSDPVNSVDPLGLDDEPCATICSDLPEGVQEELIVNGLRNGINDFFRGLTWPTHPSQVLARGALLIVPQSILNPHVRPERERATDDEPVDEEIVVTAQAIIPRIGPPPITLFARPPSFLPRPPGWNESWIYRQGEGVGRGRNSRNHYWMDPKGGWWRWDPGGKHHKPHWDYNPWSHPFSPWQNIYTPPPRDDSSRVEAAL